MTLVRHAPHLTAAEAARLARELFGVEGEVSPLPSERDCNFRVGRFVLKIANPMELRDFLEAQNLAMERLAETTLDCPRLAQPMAQWNGHWVRLLGWVDGQCMAEVQPHSAELLRSLGDGLARADLALAGLRPLRGA